MTELIEHQKAEVIVENVDQAKREVEQAFRLLHSAKSRLTATLGGSLDSLWSGNLSQYGDNLLDQVKDSHKLITQQGWRYVLKQAQIESYMTEKRQKEISEQIEKNPPELTVENIQSTLEGLAHRANGLLEESIREVFDWLRPRQDKWGVGALKTNKRFSVGPRVIVYGVEKSYGHGFRCYYRDANFRALGNVFSLLDGRGVLHYPEDFLTKLTAGLSQAETGGLIETEYFRLRPYLNGNLHIEFRRLDLLKRLNQIGGGSDLPGEER